MKKRALHLFVVAGEASGDALGARLMAALVAQTGGRIRFSGVGGPEMHLHGLNSLFPYTELSVMGLVEVLPSAAKILRRMREVATAIRRERPDVLVTIDAPGFCVGVVKRLHDHSIPRIHYVAPTVWAWRPNRVHKFRRHFDHLLALLPFEPPYFERVGLRCSFVGHPAVETVPDRDAGSKFRARHGIPPEEVVLCLLPGSRQGEVARLMEPFGQAARIVADRNLGTTLVVPTVSQVAVSVRATAGGWPVRAIVVEGTTERYAAMASSTIALAASGTVALELAVCGVPSVVGYKVAPLTGWLLRRLIRAPFVNIVNILADAEIVPEHLQENCEPGQLAASLQAILDDPLRKAAILAAQEAAISKLRGSEPPSVRAAKVVLSVISKWSTEQSAHQA